MYYDFRCLEALLMMYKYVPVYSCLVNRSKVSCTYGNTLSSLWMIPTNMLNILLHGELCTARAIFTFPFQL